MNFINKQYIVKNITIGEIISKYLYLFIWFWIILLNLGINNIFILHVDNLVKPLDQNITNVINCASIYLNVYGKIHFHNIIIKYSLIVLGIIFFLYKYLKKIHIEYIFGLGYVLSTLLKLNPFMFLTIEFSQCKQESYSFIKFLFLLYYISDSMLFIMSSFIFGMLTYVGLLFFFHWLSIKPIEYLKNKFEYMYQIYNLNIKNIKINYYEEQIVDLDKIV